LNNFSSTICRVLKAKPNQAHILLARLSIPNYLKIIAPAAKTYHLITQNVDRLSVVALNNLAEAFADKTRANRVRHDSILEMHGRLFDVKCTVCGHCVEDLSDPLCASLGAENHHVANSWMPIPEIHLPRCPSCCALARPGVVWFGEKPQRSDDINSLVFKADLCLLVGTSSEVSSCCELFLLLFTFSLVAVTCVGTPGINICVSRPAPWG
jgi:NAD-dependent deacetylase sirtuin 5